MDGYLVGKELVILLIFMMFCAVLIFPHFVWGVIINLIAQSLCHLVILYTVCKGTRSSGDKTFFMLNSAETKIYPAHKC